MNPTVSTQNDLLEKALSEIRAIAAERPNQDAAATAFYRVRQRAKSFLILAREILSVKSDERQPPAENGGGDLWQPIETAPKDGTEIDLWANECRWTNCYFGKPSHSCGEAGEYCDSDWHTDKPGWVYAPYCEPLCVAPTYWMALPAAPSVPDGNAAHSQTGVQPKDLGIKDA